MLVYFVVVENSILISTQPDVVDLRYLTFYKKKSNGRGLKYHKATSTHTTQIQVLNISLKGVCG